MPLVYNQYLLITIIGFFVSVFWTNDTRPRNVATVSELSNVRKLVGSAILTAHVSSLFLAKWKNKCIKFYSYPY